jgi:hypothetical protein
VTVEGGRPIDWLRAITDRGVDVLLVPEGRSLTAAAAASPAGLRFSADPDHAEEEDSHAKLALHAADRLISECWVYSPFGRVSGGDVSVRFNPGGAGKEKDLVSWVRNDPIRAPLLRAVPACTICSPAPLRPLHATALCYARIHRCHRTFLLHCTAGGCDLPQQRE